MLWWTVISQDIELYNPSFEDYPHSGIIGSRIIGWNDCGFSGETPPDIHASNMSNFFQVEHGAYEGLTYLGMVVRENDTWEAVSQRLLTPMYAGTCYTLSAHLCKTNQYLSGVSSRPDKGLQSYTRPVVVRIYGGNERCTRTELLAESTAINHYDWHAYTFNLKPRETFRFIIIEVFYKTPVLFPYNGHVLIDALSSLSVVSCDEIIALQETVDQPEDAIIAPNPSNRVSPQTEKPTQTRPPSEQTITKIDPTVVEPKRSDKAIPELEAYDNLKENQIIAIHDLYFKIDQSNIEKRSYNILDELYEFMIKNPKIIIEIRGHTNGLCSDSFCDELSLDRSKAVRKYLVSKGVYRYRMLVKGLGKTIPVASNDTEEGRRQNQRVEIKILSLNG